MADDEGLKVGNVEQFQQALATLQQLGSGAHESNIVLRKHHGHKVADDVAMIPTDLTTTGKALQDLLGTLPGVAVATNPTIRKNLANLSARTVTTSSLAVAVTLAREGEGLLDATVTFEDIGGKPSIVLGRQFGTDGVRVKLAINQQSGGIVGGNVEVVERFDRSGPGYTSKGSLAFDERGNIIDRTDKMKTQAGGMTVLNVPHLLSQITSFTALDQPFNVRTILQSTRVPTQPAPVKS